MSTDKAEMSFLEHLGVLRGHLIRSVIAVLVFTVLAFANKSFLFDELLLASKESDFVTYRALCRVSEWFNLGDVLCITEQPFILMNVDMSGQFTMHLWVAFITGIIVAFPYLIWELWRFVKPALHAKESNYTSGVVLMISLLFMLGVCFGYYMIAPLSVNFLGSYQVSDMVANQINLSSFISTVTTITFACGLIFQLPIAVYFLTSMGLLSPDSMKQYRSHAIVGSLVISAIITPPDLSSQILVTLPLLVLYEISIYVSKFVLKRSKSKNEITRPTNS
jgi:sec-independent protein translocase protein TatC